MSVRSSLAINRFSKVKHADDAGRTQIKMFGNNLNQFGFGFFARTVGLNGDGGRTSNADSIRKLNLTLVCKTGCNQILCNITRSVGSRTVNFGTILSGKCTAAVASISAVRLS